MKKAEKRTFNILLVLVMLCSLLSFTSAYADAPYTLTGTSLTWESIQNNGTITQTGLSLSWKDGKPDCR